MKTASGLAAMALAVAFTSAPSANAADITGSIFFPAGFSGNGYDSSNGGVPPGYGNESGNTVTVGPGIEFGFQDTYNLDTADFSSSGIVLKDSVLNVGSSGWTQTFSSDTAGYFDGLQLVSSDFGPTISYGVVGDTLTVNWSGEYDVAPADFTATFSLSPSVSAAPEPAAWALMMAAIAMVGGMLRFGRQRRAPAAA